MREKTIAVRFFHVLGISALFSAAAIAQTITVTTTSDVVDGTTTSVSALQSAQGADGKISLREAITAVNNTGTGYTIIVPAGTYSLTSSVLQITKSNTTLQGAGSSLTTISETVASTRIFLPNPSFTSGFTFSISGMTLTGGTGTGSLGGGGAINCGGVSNVTNVSNCTFTSNSGGTTGGGAIDSYGGVLNLSNCTFTSNSATASGGAVRFQATSGSTHDTLYVTGCSFSSNTSAAGGALSLSDANLYTKIRQSSFASNLANSSSINNGGGGIYIGGGTLDMSYSRITGNTISNSATATAIYANNTPTITINDNWWGISTGPPSGSFVNVTSPTTYLQLRNSPTASSLVSGNGTTLTADLLGRNSGGAISGSNLTGLPTFQATVFGSAVLGTLSGATQFVNGVATATYTAGGTGGSGSAVATADNQTATASITVLAPPTVTSSAATNITSTTATLNGTINANSASTTVTFDYGTTVGYGSSIAATPSPVTGSSNTSVSASLSGLTANTLYHFRVKGVNSGGTTNGSDLSLTTVVTAPTATAASSITATTLSANWGSVSGATKYYLDVATDNVFGSFVSGYNNLDVGNVTTYGVSSLSANTTYYYRVRGFNSNGTSINSNTITVLTAPSTPTATAASSVVQTSMSANWNSVSGATGYKLDVSTDNAFGSFISGFNNLDAGNVTTKSVTSLTANTTYYYRVRAYNSSATGSSSNTITQATLPNAPSTPTPSSASSITAPSFSANWSASGGATGYRLDVSTSNGFGSFVAGFNNLDVSNVTTYSVTGLSANTTYYYRVRAYNTGGTSGSSSTISQLTAPTAPTANAASSVATTSLTANWSAATGATGYRLDVSTSNSFGSFVSGFNSLDVSNVTTYSVTGLSGNTTYYYRVRAYNTGGTGTSSSTITQTTAPSTPTATSASNITTTGFSANWNSVSGATGYRLDVSSDNAFGSFVSGFSNLDAGNVTTMSVTGLGVNATYYYRVRAYSANGTSGSSNTITQATSASAPAATTNSASSITTTGATLNGTVNASNASTTVTFEYGLTTGYGTSATATQSPISGSSNTSVSASISSLSPNTTYHYRVKGVNATGTTNGSDQTLTTTAAAPTVTTNAATSTATTTATLNGTVNANNQSTVVTFDYGLTVSYGTSVTAAESPATGTSNTAVSKAISGLIPNSTYHFRVVGVNATGTTNGSDQTFGTAAAAPTATTNAASSITDVSVTLNGTVNANNASTTVRFLYGTTSGTYPDSAAAAQSPVTGTSAAGVSFLYQSLVPNTTYYFLVSATNSAAYVRGSETSVTTTADIPVASTTAATNINATNATLNGSVNAKNANTVVRFLYGTVSGTYNDSVVAAESPVTGMSASSVSAGLTGLTGNTTYFVRVSATNIAGYVVGSEQSFAITTQIPVELTGFSAESQRLNADLKWHTVTESANYGFEVERSVFPAASTAGSGVKSWSKVGFVKGSGETTTPRDYSFTDRVGSAGKFLYRLKQIDRDGDFKYSPEVTVEVGVAPKVFALSQNYPNPFNPATTIEFTLPENGHARLTVYNLLGQEVGRVFDDAAESGKYLQGIFSASNLSTGVYIARLEFEPANSKSGGRRQLLMKMLLMK